MLPAALARRIVALRFREDEGDFPEDAGADFREDGALPEDAGALIGSLEGGEISADLLA
jgi:hypothetical protein